MRGEFASDRIRTLRETLGLNQIQFARLLGVSNVTVNRWEHDHAHPRTPMVDRLLALEAGDSGGIGGTRPFPGMTAPPGVTGRLIGRNDEFAELCSLIEPARLVTIIGPGGVGKTRLAIEAAVASQARFERVHFVDLAVVTDEAAVIHAVARALGIHETAAQPLADLIAGAAHDHACLIVLDNCEHVRRAVARLASAIIGDDARSCVLATSRIELGVGGEHRFPLRPLGAEDAVRLFVERADLKPDAAALDSIAELCRHLDGLPLAIELAAARCPLLSPRQIADRLDRRFEVLRSHEADIRRWNTLRATIAWSCALLSADEARLFRSLSVFTGSFDFGAVEAISDLDANLDLLEGLVNQSMLVIELRPGESAARYRLLESLRDYAREWAREHQEIEPVAARHAHHYQGVSREAATLLNTPAHLEALARFDREHDNIVAALEWMIAAGASRDACDLAASLTPWWHRSSRFDLATRYLERALALAPDDVSIQAARAGNAFALIALSAGRLGHGEASVERAIVITRTIGDRAGEAEALTLKERYLQRIGELDRAEGMFSAALEIRTADGDQRGMGVNLLNLGTIAGLKRDFVTCGATYHRAWTHANASGDLATEAVILGNLGELAAHTGEYQRGLEYLDRATAIFRQFGDHDRVAATLTNRAELYLLLGDYPGAVETSAMTVAQHRETRNRIHLANSLYVQGIALAAIGALLQALGAFREGARLEYELNDLTNVIYYIEAIARLLGEGDDPLLAARLLGGAERLREEERAGDYEPFDYAGTVRATRARLSEAQFAAAWQSGRELSPAGLLTEASNLGLIADGAPVFLYRRMPGRPAPGNELTPRQIDVLRLVAHGESNRQIAETLAISPRTVERHLTMIYGHFGVDRRSAAVAAAAERGLL